MKQFLLFFLCVFFLNSFGQTQIDTIYVKSSLTHLFDKYHIPDASIIVSQHGKEVFKLDKNNENTNKNYFIGSCSKSFTALAILQLVDAGKIKLDSPVQKYLPWFSLKDTAQSRKITIRHLLNQTSGMRKSDGHFGYLSSGYTDFEKEFSAYLKRTTLLSQPGEIFSYCNSNYTLLGLIIAKVSNQSYESYLEEYIFSKVEMENTYASYKKGSESDMVIGYQDWFHLYKTSKVYEYSDYFVPTGAITSNSDDLAKYLNCLLNNGITQNGDTLVSQNSLKLLTTAKSKGYAMGWMTNVIAFNSNFKNQFDIPFIYHIGSVNNYVSSIAIYPEEGVTISVLANSNSFEFTKEVLNIVLASANNGQYQFVFSNEKLFKKVVLILVVVVFIIFLININRWKRYNFKFNTISNFYTIIRLFIGLILSIGVLFVFKFLYDIQLSLLIAAIPDFGYSFLFICVIGILSSLIRYFGTIKE